MLQQEAAILSRSINPFWSNLRLFQHVILKSPASEGVDEIHARNGRDAVFLLRDIIVVTHPGTCPGADCAGERGHLVIQVAAVLRNAEQGLQEQADVSGAVRSHLAVDIDVRVL